MTSRPNHTDAKHPADLDAARRQTTSGGSGDGHPAEVVRCSDEADDQTDVTVPMLLQPTRLPGRASERFSPAQFYALSRVTRPDVDTDDEGLWLTEEKCPTINPEGILVGGVRFFDGMLQEIVDVAGVAPDRDLVIRYNRAHLARGVLSEVIVLERDAAGGYRERCRCRPKHLVSQVDLNRVLRDRERLKKQLLAKVARGHELRITIEQGTKALEELRDEQARQARLQRRAKREPIAAAPVNAKTRRESEQARETANVLNMTDRLQQATAPRTAASATASEALAAATPTTPRRGRRGSRKKGEATGASATEPTPSATDPGYHVGGASTLAADTTSAVGSSPSATTAEQSPADAPPEARVPELADYLGAHMGFHAADDE